MPRNSHVVIRIYSDGKVENETTEREIGTAVPFPEWHGRLIDADELDECYCFDEQEKYDNYVVTVGVIRQNIKDAHTIVPAEGGATK